MSEFSAKLRRSALLTGLLSCSFVSHCLAAAEKAAEATADQKAVPPEGATGYVEMFKEWLSVYGPGLLIAITILIGGRWLAMFVSSLAKRAMLRAGVDETLIRFLSKLVYYTLLAAVVIAAADQVGIKTSSFLAILGAAGLAIGLALKDSLANFASGVMLILFRPFKVGDLVGVGGVTGSVERIDIFSTVVYTGDNQKIIIPNSKITTDIITNVNAEETRRIDLIIGIGYDDDIRLAKSTLEELVKGDGRILTDPAPTIGVGDLGASSVDLVVRPWVKATDYWGVRMDLLEKIKTTFDEKSISIPYPQQDVHLFQQSQ